MPTKKKTTQKIGDPVPAGAKKQYPAGTKVDQFGNTPAQYAGKTSEISRPSGTPKGTGTELIGKSEEDARAISEANAREGQARSLRQMAADANLLQAKLQAEDAAAEAASPEGQAKQALANQIAPAGIQQPAPNTLNTANTQQPSQNVPQLTPPPELQANIDTVNQNQLQNQAVGGALAIGVGTLAIGTASAAAAEIGGATAISGAVKATSTATKLFGIGSVAALIGKVAGNKRQDVKVAAANFKASKKNMGDIINAKNAGLISDEQALEYWNKEVANIAAQESALRQMTDTWIGKELSNGLDELAAIEGFNADYAIYLKPKFQRAILTPDPNAAAVNFETPEVVG